MKAPCSDYTRLRLSLQRRFWLLIINLCLVSSVVGGETGFTLYKSTDRGASWFQVGQGLPRNARINALTTTGKTQLAGTDQGIFISWDGGVEWLAAPKSISRSFPRPPDLGKFSPEFRVLCFTTLDGRVFAGTERQGVQVSDDAGVSWKPANDGLADAYIRSLLAVGTNLYAGTDREGVFVSENGGVSWRQQKAGLPDFSQVFDLASINGAVFAGLYSKGLYRWEVERRHWSKVGAVVPLELAAAGKILVAGHNPGGVFVSEDMGKSWHDGNSGLPDSAPVWTLAAGDQTRILVGTSGKIALSTDDIGLFASEDGGKSWQRSDAGLPSSSAAISFMMAKEFILAGISASKSQGYPPAR